MDTPMKHTFSKQLPAVKAWLGTGSINIFGFPYAGKDMHGRELAEFLDAPLLSGGDILRNSTIPARVKEAMHAGLLVPSQDYINIVTPFLSNPDFEERPLILSSLGRWIGEEEGVIGALNTTGHPLKAVIYLNIDETTVWERWHDSQAKQDRGERADDAEHIIEARLAEFRNKTLPVIEHYRKLGLLIEFDSKLSKAEVTKRIIDELFKKAIV